MRCRHQRLAHLVDDETCSHEVVEMTRFRLSSKVQIFVGCALVALLIVGGISYRALLIARESDRSVQHTREALASLNDFLMTLERIDSAYRGFLLTGRDADLASLSAARVSAAQAVAQIRTLTADNPEQQRQLRRLESLVTQKFDALGIAIGVRQAGGMAAAADSIRSELGNRTGQLQEVVGRLRAEELRVLVGREATATRHQAQATAVVILGSVLGFMMAA